VNPATRFVQEFTLFERIDMTTQELAGRKKKVIHLVVFFGFALQILLIEMYLKDIRNIPPVYAFAGVFAFAVVVSLIALGIKGPVSIGLLAAFPVIAYQVYLWLKFGQWVPIPLVEALELSGINYLPVVNTSWEGVQKIGVWIIRLPLSIVVFVLGCMAGYLGSSILNKVRG
jgi:hypothetical protein